ncbi:MAG: 2-polyprenyl-3-methyl-6-methoxy-1,4-benzoquinone monooxygenase [Gammaproteobacteria bacterium]|nr:2-polyprenyl-3-methyl-6-methoxy-1,4-benzoquinone monooxygenase [Gammaproteobacteria bacterium]
MDRVIGSVDARLRAAATMSSDPVADSERPGVDAPEQVHSREQRRHVAGLMRVNHAGEVAAQALYEGHALLARTSEQRAQMGQAAEEERRHLEWCHARLKELGAGPSKLDPVWFGGALLAGMAAAAAGDKWSLGFVAETERQVVEHLQGHLSRLPADDHRTRAILEQMISDEARHGRDAVDAGGQDLPAPVRALMRMTAKVMTRSAYWV